jgi:hypothetical protein
VAIGGVGGSGTRVVAEIIRQFGYYMGEDLNESNDNLWYSLLFKLRGVADLPQREIDKRAFIFSAAMSGQTIRQTDHLDLVRALSRVERYNHDIGWLRKRSDSLVNRLRNNRQAKQYWAWKEPNTHVLVERLVSQLPNLRYIHVIRDGLDMAYSSNRTQLHYWANDIYGMKDPDYTSPSTALRYWRLANERIVQLKTTNTMPILEIGFEALCHQTISQIMLLARFCNASITTNQAQFIAERTVHTPKTIGRYREMNPTDLNPDDCRYAAEMKSRLFT